MLSPKQFVLIHLNKLEKYISGVTSSIIVIGKYERLAVERFIELKSKYQYRESELIRVLKFFSLLNISNQNKISQIELLGFQVFWLANIYALYNGERRLFDQVYIEIAKKNGKSSFFAALSLYECIGDNELNASIINVASTREQARIMLDYTKTIIDNSPMIESYFTINRNIVYNKSKGIINRIEVRASDAKRIQGTNCNAVFCDEYAFWNDSELMLKLKSGQIARQNSLMVIITTAANNLQSPAYVFRETATNILEGKVSNDSLFTQIFSLDSKEEIEQPDMWRKSNPAINYIFSQSDLQKEFESAKVFKDKYYTFLTDNLNLWTNNNTLEEVWIEDDRIVDVMFTGITISNCKTYYGVDLSKNRDLNSIAELTQTSTGDFEVIVTNVIPNNDKVRIRENGSIDLSRWFINSDNPNGYIHRCNTEVLDEELIFDFFVKFKENNKVQAVGFDPFHATAIAHKLESKLGLSVHHIRQNWSLTPAISLLERLIYLKKIKIKRNPVVRWNFQNTSLYVSPSNGNLHLTKKGNKEAIDSVVAITVAFATWIKENQNPYHEILNMYSDINKSEK